jgi:prophage regulatory protein
MSLEHAPQRSGVRILRQRQVLELLGISGSTLWQWVKDGRFPRPIPLGPNSVAWLQDEIDQHLLGRAKERDRQREAGARPAEQSA